MLLVCLLICLLGIVFWVWCLLCCLGCCRLCGLVGFGWCLFVFVGYSVAVLDLGLLQVSICVADLLFNSVVLN